jgi:hypothetical protein
MVVRLRPTSRTLRIETDDARIERYVKTAYGNNLLDPTHAATDVAVLTTGSEAPVVSFNGVALSRDWPGPGKNPWQSGAYIIDQFVWRALANDPDWMALYACAVVSRERAVLLVGASGVGKTTLGFALQRLGASIIGDEMVLVHRDDVAVGAIDRRLSVRWGTDDPLDDPALHVLIRNNAALVGAGEDGFLAVDRRVFGAVPPPAKLAATFVVTRGEREPLVAPASASRTALSIAPYLGVRPQGLDDIARVARALARGRCFTLNLGAPHAAARAVLGALTTC